ncbi:MAG TPA: hypothetical protein VG900_06090, partial [Hyphomicrobiaceae bacterium]|nr:hypothetical protein [Hyphomicrobiaceae bacterium]
LRPIRDWSGELLPSAQRTGAWPVSHQVVICRFEQPRSNAGSDRHLHGTGQKDAQSELPGPNPAIGQS